MNGQVLMTCIEASHQKAIKNILSLFARCYFMITWSYLIVDHVGVSSSGCNRNTFNRKCLQASFTFGEIIFCTAYCYFILIPEQKSVHLMDIVVSTFTRLAEYNISRTSASLLLALAPIRWNWNKKNLSASSKRPKSHKQQGTWSCLI